MKLQTIFDQLTYGELAQLAIGGGDDGEISEANYPRILAHLNMGLTSLYKRFPLKEGRVKLQLQDDITRYSITSNLAVSNRKSREPVKYLLDSSVDPFKDDILKIEQVLNDDKKGLPLNDWQNPYSLMTPSVSTLTVPEEMVNGSLEIPVIYKTDYLMLVYRANHTPITMGAGAFYPDREEVELPDSHLQALLYFIASRCHNPVGMTNEFHAGNSWYAKYEAECRDLETQNLRVDQGSQNTKLHSKGWV